MTMCISQNFQTKQIFEPICNQITLIDCDINNKLKEGCKNLGLKLRSKNRFLFRPSLSLSFLFVRSSSVVVVINID